MRPAEQGFLLLTSYLGDPDRRPLSLSQLRILGNRMANMPKPSLNRELTAEDLLSIGYGGAQAQRILSLLEDGLQLERYLLKGKKHGCVPLTRVSGYYPQRLRDRLGQESPGCLWAKGDLSLLNFPRIALVGSRDIHPENREFAREAGAQAARQGYVLVSGNARGADRIAQDACLQNGGRVICVIADELSSKTTDDRILYLSEDDFDQPFSALRALSRNRIIHSLCEKTLVAQSRLHTGGTWDGTVKNLRQGLSSVFCFQDGSSAADALVQLGAEPIIRSQLKDFAALQPLIESFLK